MVAILVVKCSGEDLAAKRGAERSVGAIILTKNRLELLYRFCSGHYDK